MRFHRAGAGGGLHPSYAAGVRRHAGEMALTEQYLLCPSEGERKHMPCGKVPGGDVGGQPDAGMRMCPTCPASVRAKKDEGGDTATVGGNDGLTGRTPQGIGRMSPHIAAPKKESSCRPRVPALPLFFHFSGDDTPAGLPAGESFCGGDMRVFFPSLRMLSALLTGFLPKAPPCVLSDGRRTPQRFFPLQPPSCGHPA